MGKNCVRIEIKKSESLGHPNVYRYLQSYSSKSCILFEKSVPKFTLLFIETSSGDVIPNIEIDI